MSERRNRRERRTATGPVGSSTTAPKMTLRVEPQHLEELSRRAKSRAELYEILSLVFQEMPTPELLAIFKHSAFLEILNLLTPPETVQRWQKFANGKMPLDHLHARLRLEYNNLFLVPTSQRIVPRESAFFYERGQPQAPQRRIEDVLKFYRRIGMSPMAKFKEQPDHISQILHFMSVLCEREKEYLEKRNAPQLESTCVTQADFVSRHLVSWIGALRERMYRATRFMFFRDVADLMERFVAGEQEWTAKLLDTYIIRKVKPGAPAARKPGVRPGTDSISLPRREGAPGEATSGRRRRRRRGGRGRKARSNER